MPGGGVASWAVSLSSAPIAAVWWTVLDLLFTCALTGSELEQLHTVACTQAPASSE